jgi:hypothetical protein
LDKDGLFEPEYVNVFGVPLSIFQDVGDGGALRTWYTTILGIKSLDDARRATSVAATHGANALIAQDKN